MFIRFVCLVGMALSFTSCQGWQEALGLNEDNPLVKSVEEWVNDNAGMDLDVLPEEDAEDGECHEG